jgi:hypothetical protein
MEYFRISRIKAAFLNGIDRDTPQNKAEMPA